jgi:hypothetical protein
VHDLGQITGKSSLGDLVISPDTKYITEVLKGTYVAMRRDVTTWAQAGGYGFYNGGSANAGAYTGDGKYFVSGGGGMQIFASGSSVPISQINLGDAIVPPHGLAASSGGNIFAVTLDQTGFHLTVLPGPESAKAPPVLPRLGLGFPLAVGTAQFLRATVVDSAHAHVFVSGGAASSEVAVTDLTGKRTGYLSDMFGATDMILSPNGRYLYVLLTAGDAVAVVDTATLKTTALLSTGTWRTNPPSPSEEPQHIALAAGRIWVNQAKFGDQIHLGSVDANAPAATWTDSGNPTNLNSGLMGATPATNELLVYVDGAPQFPTTIYTASAAGTATATSTIAFNAEPDGLTSAGQILAGSNNPAFAGDELLETVTGAVVRTYANAAGLQLLTTDDRYLISLVSSSDHTSEYVALYNETTGAALAHSAAFGTPSTTLGVSPDASRIYVTGWTLKGGYVLHALYGPTSGKPALTPVP